jgi:NAD-dependent deacetylase
MHLHGEIRKARSTKDARLIYEISGSDINEGDLCELGSQLRPHIVWFHEDVPMMEPAIALTQTADIFLIVGTSLQVYPAASLVHFVRSGVPVFVVDPVIPNIPGLNRSRCIEEGGSAGLERFRELLKDGYLAG